MCGVPNMQFVAAVACGTCISMKTGSEPYHLRIALKTKLGSLITASTDGTTKECLLSEISP